MIYKPEDLNLVQVEKHTNGNISTTIIVIQLKDGTQKIYEMFEEIKS